MCWLSYEDNDDAVLQAWTYRKFMSALVVDTMIGLILDD